jgi:cobalt-zinc-cadmium efflux system outer membrane protein
MYRTVFAIGLLLAASIATAKQNDLTEDMALQIGLGRDLVQQRMSASINQAKSGSISASAWSNPEISYEREALDGIDSVEQKIIISQEFDFSGRRGLHMKAADLHMNAAEYESMAWRSEFEKDIRARYYDALYQQKRQQAYKDTQQRISVLNQALKLRRDDGDVSIYDYQKVVTERASIEAEVNNAGADFNTAWIGLWALLGPGSNEYAMLAGELLPGSPPSLQQVSITLDDQPRLQHLKARSEAYDMQQDAENRTFPDVTLGLGWKRAEVGSASDDGLIINASIPLPLFDQRKANQFRYQAQAMTAQSEFELAYDSATSELEGLWQQVRQYRKSAVEYRAESVHAVSELIEIAEAYYRAGEIGIMELLDAYQSGLDAELTAIDFEYKARIARIKLDYLTGGPAR